MRQLRIQLFFLGLLFAALQAGAADWPQWRGPDRTDISKETGLLKRWPAGGPEPLWLAKDLGMGYSGPAIVGDRLYIMGTASGGTDKSRPAGNGECYARAYDVGSGRLVWKTKLAEAGGPRKRKWADGPRSTPTVDGDRVYCFTGGGVLACLKKSDGSLVWKKSAREFKGSMGNWFYTESPLIDGDKLIFTPGGPNGAIVALDKSTGSTKWVCKEFTDKAEYSSIIAVNHGNGRQYIQRSQKNVVGVAADSGKQLWKVPFDGRTAVIPTPIYSDGFVFVAAGYGKGSKLIKIDANNRASDAVAQRPIMINHHGGVILLDGHLYGHCDKKGWLCLEFKTGKEVWASKKFGKGAITYADGHFYCLDERSGNVALVEASTDGWKEKSRFKLTAQTQRRPSGKVWTHPVVCNGRLYLRDQELLSCYDIRAK
jgi:outer membrane protein assembly factor BamB